MHLLLSSFFIAIFVFCPASFGTDNEWDKWIVTYSRCKRIFFFVRVCSFSPTSFGDKYFVEMPMEPETKMESSSCINICALWKVIISSLCFVTECTPCVLLPLHYISLHFLQISLNLKMVSRHKTAKSSSGRNLVCAHHFFENISAEIFFIAIRKFICQGDCRCGGYCINKI